MDAGSWAMTGVLTIYLKNSTPKHFSAEWQEELAAYCAEHALEINDAAAEEFVHYRSEQLEAAMESGEA